MKNKIYGRQGWHILALLILLAGTIFLFNQSSAAHEGQLFNLSTSFWFWLGIAVPVLHQGYVIFFWRGELYNNWMSDKFGSKEKAFKIFTRGFAILIISRPISAFLLAISNYDSLPLSWPLRIIISLILFAGFAWMMYSVVNYFGVINAFGRDHFYPEEYRGKTLEKRGLFKYVDNGMYSIGFAIVWVPAVLFASQAGLILAAFSHLYIWVHWYTVEKPDMEYIYSE